MARLLFGQSAAYEPQEHETDRHLRERSAYVHRGPCRCRHRGRSRAGLSYQEAFDLIKRKLIEKASSVHGRINIVISTDAAKYLSILLLRLVAFP